MATDPPKNPTESNEGRGIQVAASATPGTKIHDTSASADYMDIISLWLCNTDDKAHVAVVEWGGTTDPDDLIKILVRPHVGLVQVADKLPLGGDGSAKSIRVYDEDDSELISCFMKYWRIDA